MLSLADPGAGCSLLLPIVDLCWVLKDSLLPPPQSRAENKRWFIASWLGFISPKFSFIFPYFFLLSLPLSLSFQGNSPLQTFANRKWVTLDARVAVKQIFYTLSLCRVFFKHLRVHLNPADHDSSIPILNASGLSRRYTTVRYISGLNWHCLYVIAVWTSQECSQYIPWDL